MKGFRMDLPFLYKGEQPLEISGKVILDLVSMLKDYGLEDEFLQEVEARGLKFPVPPQIVNLMKSYLFTRKLHKSSELAEEVITSAHCPKRPDSPWPV